MLYQEVAQWYKIPRYVDGENGGGEGENLARWNVPYYASVTNSHTVHKK